VKYHSNNPKLEKLEKIQTFIFEKVSLLNLPNLALNKLKKSKNALKYSINSKVNLTALPVPRGTISIMLNVAKKDYGFNLSSLKKRIPPKSKFKMKWKAIQWLIHNKKG